MKLTSGSDRNVSNIFQNGVVRIALFSSVFGFPCVDHKKTQVKSNQNKIKELKSKLKQLKKTKQKDMD